MEIQQNKEWDYKKRRDIMENNHHNNKEKDTNHSVSVSGNATGVQIQQNVSNSTQTQAVNEVFEYEKVRISSRCLKILTEMKRNKY